MTKHHEPDPDQFFDFVLEDKSIFRIDLRRHWICGIYGAPWAKSWTEFDRLRPYTTPEGGIGLAVLVGGPQDPDARLLGALQVPGVVLAALGLDMPAWRGTAPPEPPADEAPAPDGNVE